MKFLKKINHFFFRKNKKLTWVSLAVLGIAYWYCLPKPLFQDPTCMVIEDREGNLMGARIASDGQWRFPQPDTVPHKFEQAILTFEDKRFYRHFGFDPIAFVRAMKQNISNGRVVSGGSTLTMQTIRLSRKGKPRSLFQKIVEALLATRLEFRHSKKDILAMYASHAPFGGNVVGLDAATWRYYAKPASQLSWSEVATLAVLPNSPALIHPGRNRQQLLEKRNRLIDRMAKGNIIDKTTAELAKEEPLPNKPFPLPRLAPHLLDRAFVENFSNKKNQQTRLQTTIDSDMQKNVNEILQRQQLSLQANGIHNAAALVIEIETGNVVAYVGNVPGAGTSHGEQVDIIKAPRSTGSILKPFLYAFMLQEGKVLPKMLIPDVPTVIGSYRPENFYQTYDGMVTAERAIVRSLNVPLVKMLQNYSYEKFHYHLNKVGFSTMKKPADHYGLSLILGGAEANLWDVSNTYANMARTINYFYDYDGEYNPEDFRQPNYVYKNSASNFPKDKKRSLLLEKEAPFISASASWQAFEAMRNLERPNSEGDWESFSSSQTIAWKTGTSFGFRDAWAVGVTPRYAVGVWAGNADGEGRSGLIGVKAAAPILFDIFNLLPAGNWFEQPVDEMIQVPICKQSGFRALPICEADSMWVTQSGLKSAACPYHQTIHLDANKKYQVNADCESTSEMVHEPWFILPPVEEYYFKSKNPSYKTLPPYRADCNNVIAKNDRSPMQLIYPKDISKIQVPVDLDGELSRTVFKIAHRIPTSTVHWHLDNTYIGSTSDIHEMELNPEAGKHLLTLVDEKGYRLEQRFQIVTK